MLTSGFIYLDWNFKICYKKILQGATEKTEHHGDFFSRDYRAVIKLSFNSAPSVSPCGKLLKK